MPSVTRDMTMRAPAQSRETVNLPNCWQIAAPDGVG
jgi:hypothetical protein